MFLKKPSLCQNVFGLPHPQQVEVGKVGGDDRKGKGVFVVFEVFSAFLAKWDPHSTLFADSIFTEKQVAGIVGCPT